MRVGEERGGRGKGGGREGGREGAQGCERKDIRPLSTAAASRADQEAESCTICFPAAALDPASVNYSRADQEAEPQRRARYALRAQGPHGRARRGASRRRLRSQTAGRRLTRSSPPPPRSPPRARCPSPPHPASRGRHRGRQSRLACRPRRLPRRHPLSLPPLQGWEGCGVARVAGCQSATTPTGSRVTKEMTGSLFEPKNHRAHHNIEHHGDNLIPSLLFNIHRSQIYVIYIYILMNVFTYIAIKKNQNPDPEKYPGRAGQPGSLGAAGRGSLISPGSRVAGRGSAIPRDPANPAPPPRRPLSSLPACVAAARSRDFVAAAAAAAAAAAHRSVRARLRGGRFRPARGILIPVIVLSHRRIQSLVRPVRVRPDPFAHKPSP